MNFLSLSLSTLPMQLEASHRCYTQTERCRRWYYLWIPSHMRGQQVFSPALKKVSSQTNQRVSPLSTHNNRRWCPLLQQASAKVYRFLVSDDVPNTVASHDDKFIRRSEMEDLDVWCWKHARLWWIWWVDFFFFWAIQTNYAYILNFKLVISDCSTRFFFLKIDERFVNSNCIVGTVRSNDITPLRSLTRIRVRSRHPVCCTLAASAKFRLGVWTSQSGTAWPLRLRTCQLHEKLHAMKWICLVIVPFHYRQFLQRSECCRRWPSLPHTSRHARPIELRVSGTPAPPLREHVQGRSLYRLAERRLLINECKMTPRKLAHTESFSCCMKGKRWLAANSAARAPPCPSNIPNKAKWLSGSLFPHEGVLQNFQMRDVEVFRDRLSDLVLIGQVMCSVECGSVCILHALSFALNPKLSISDSNSWYWVFRKGDITRNNTSMQSLPYLLV